MLSTTACSTRSSTVVCSRSSKPATSQCCWDGRRCWCAQTCCGRALNDMNPNRIVPCVAMLLCVVLTSVVSAAVMQLSALRKLGVALRFHPDHPWMLLLQSNGRKPPGSQDNRSQSDGGELGSDLLRYFNRGAAIECRNPSFTDEPIFFCGDSQLQHFCQCEGVTRNPTSFFWPIFPTELALRSLGGAEEVNVVILHCGYADMMSDPSGDKLIDGYREILERLKEKLTLVLLPEAINEHAIPSYLRKGVDNGRLQSVRKRLSELCAIRANVRTVDISPYVVDSTGNVDPCFLDDYIHFNGRAYDLWWEMIRKALHGWVRER